MGNSQSLNCTAGEKSSKANKKKEQSSKTPVEQVKENGKESEVKPADGETPAAKSEDTAETVGAESEEPAASAAADGDDTKKPETASEETKQEAKSGEDAKPEEESKLAGGETAAAQVEVNNVEAAADDSPAPTETAEVELKIEESGDKDKSDNTEAAQGTEASTSETQKDEEKDAPSNDEVESLSAAVLSALNTSGSGSGQIKDVDSKVEVGADPSVLVMDNADEFTTQSSSADTPLVSTDLPCSPSDGTELVNASTSLNVECSNTSPASANALLSNDLVQITISPPEDQNDEVIDTSESNLENNSSVEGHSESSVEVAKEEFSATVENEQSFSNDFEAPNINPDNFSEETKVSSSSVEEFKSSSIGVVIEPSSAEQVVQEVSAETVNISFDEKVNVSSEEISDIPDEDDTVSFTEEISDTLDGEVNVSFTEEISDTPDEDDTVSFTEEISDTTDKEVNESSTVDILEHTECGEMLNVSAVSLADGDVEISSESTECKPTVISEEVGMNPSSEQALQSSSAAVKPEPMETIVTETESHVTAETAGDNLVDVVAEENICSSSNEEQIDMSSVAMKSDSTLKELTPKDETIEHSSHVHIVTSSSLSDVSESGLDTTVVEICAKSEEIIVIPSSDECDVSNSVPVVALELDAERSSAAELVTEDLSVEENVTNFDADVAPALSFDNSTEDRDVTSGDQASSEIFAVAENKPLVVEMEDNQCLPPVANNIECQISKSLVDDNTAEPINNFNTISSHDDASSLTDNTELIEDANTENSKEVQKTEESKREDKVEDDSTADSQSTPKGD